MFHVHSNIVYNSQTAKCLSAQKQINKKCYIHTMEQHLTMEINEVLIYAIKQRKLENIMLSQLQKKPHILHDSTYLKSPEQANPQIEEVNQCLPGPGGIWEQGGTANEYRVPFGVDKNILKLDSGVVAHWIVYFKWVNFMFI